MVRNFDTGQYKLFQLEYNDGNLIEATDIDFGQLPVKPNVGRIAAAKVREAELRNERGESRDDIIYFDDVACEIIRTDARFDPDRGKLTYCWAYTSGIVVEPVRIPEQRPYAVMLCKFKDQQPDPKLEKYFREIFTPGTGGLIEYWHDVSLGAVDVSGSRVFGWIELDVVRMDLEKDHLNHSRAGLINLAIAATQKAGFDITGFPNKIAVFTHNYTRDVQCTNVCGHFWLDGSFSGGNVSAPPHMHSGSVLAHEMGHGLGFPDDDVYNDKYCIMSAGRVLSFAHPVWNNVLFGPTMSFPQLAIKNWTLPGRVLTVNSNWVNATTATNFMLAPMSDRKIDACIGVILPADDGNSVGDYYLEYQRSIGWNQSIPASLVIRRRKDGTASLLGEVLVPTVLGGKTKWLEPWGNVNFEVEKIRNDDRVIRVSVSKPPKLKLKPKIVPKTKLVKRVPKS